ncbi:fat storage-inducing transmembrane protein 2 [Fundulus heteroclitus]|uniref:fat storage-inducing transmembrane protein 2 n=1 Tax=Fundulus heteroclitus TaxID=8078 RepID=UPI00165B1641|nr:fat storage-inducing transmembrane protein 2 [Fundulus heteroclitus]
MATMDVIVERLVSVWRIPSVRQNFPWLFLLISFVGSFLKHQELVPQSYFSSSKNLVNVYFVKLSWGWTLLLLTPFVLISSSFSSSASYLVRRLSSLVVATFVWYVCTGAFLHIEDIWGTCSESRTSLVATKGFTSKATCRQAGFHWQGFDISGHSFILTYSSLLIMEETSPMAFLRTAGLPALYRTALNLLYVALNLIVMTWVWMFFCTSVYFHDPMDKILGTGCGLLGWYLTYRCWYLRRFSPGLPLQPQLKEQKQHA